MRAKAEIETGQTHDKIVVTEIPYNVNKAELIKYLMSENSNIWAANANGGVENFKWTGLDPGTEYTFAYMAEDWDGVLTDVKIVKATTEAIIAGPNPTMQLNGYQVSTQLLNRMIRQVKPNDWLLYVCLLVPMLMEMK